MGTNLQTQRTKAQHYVPRFYLRGFTNASKKLFCYDKASDRVYPTSPADAAHETGFYEIYPGTTERPVPANAVEDQLAKFDAVFATRLDELVRSADRGKVTAEQLVFFSPLVALQWMRTKTYRDTAHEILQKFGQAEADDLIRLNFPGQEPKVKVTFPKETMAAVQAEHMLNPDTLLRMARGLDKLIWVIGINNTGRSFYTSDHPVVRRGNCRDAGGPLVGINDRGVEFAFPLDSRHVLRLLDRRHFKEWRDRDGRVVELTADEVGDLNGLQVRRSCQRVYCSTDDFEPAKQVCKVEPAVCDPNRPRVRVGSTSLVDDGDAKRNLTYVVSLE